MGVTVTYRNNNSGGSWWLSTADWEALEREGWNVHWVSPRTDGGMSKVPLSAYSDPLAPCPRDRLARYLCAEAVSAAKRFECKEDAVEEFERITGQDTSDEGCGCCGPPHEFTALYDDGRKEYASAEATRTELIWG